MTNPLYDDDYFQDFQITEPAREQYLSGVRKLTDDEYLAFQVEVMEFVKEVLSHEDWQGSAVTYEETDDAVIEALDFLIKRAKVGDL